LFFALFLFCITFLKKVQDFLMTAYLFFQQQPFCCSRFSSRRGLYLKLSSTEPTLPDHTTLRRHLCSLSSLVSSGKTSIGEIVISDVYGCNIRRPCAMKQWWYQGQTNDWLTNFLIVWFHYRNTYCRKSQIFHKLHDTVTNRYG
jgi:hypothetical protein